MNDTCGRTSGKQFATYDPESSSWRMWPDTGLWGSIEYAETWPKTGWMSGGRAFERPTSAPRTIESACLSSQVLPTPVAQPSGNSPEAHLRKKPGRTQVTDLSIIVENGLLATGGKMLPTPTASDADKARDNPAQASRKSPPISAVSVHFPTPEAKNSHARPDYARMKRKNSGGHDLVTSVTILSNGGHTPPLFDAGSV